MEEKQRRAAAAKGGEVKKMPLPTGGGGSRRRRRCRRRPAKALSRDSLTWSPLVFLSISPSYPISLSRTQSLAVALLPIFLFRRLQGTAQSTVRRSQRVRSLPTSSPTFRCLRERIRRAQSVRGTVSRARASRRARLGKTSRRVSRGRES